jgi:hypothetical protein
MHYGIFGTGLAKKNVIEDCLSDLASDGDTIFHIYGCRGASESQKRVYDWLLDNEAQFIVYGSSINSILKDAALSVVETDDAEKEMLEKLTKVTGEILFLWDDAEPEQSEEFVFRANPYNLQMKDLTMGLTPIAVEVDLPTEPKELTYTDIETVEVDVPEAVVAQPTPTVSSNPVEKKSPIKVETTEEKPCMATIVLPNGTITSLLISMEEAKMILGLG